MKYITLLIICLLFANLSMAQQAGIRITNETIGKEIYLVENKRIRLKTFDGRKLSGRFTVADATALWLNGERIDLSRIAEIKRHPLLVSILSGGFLIYGGAVTAGFGVIIGIFVDSAGFLLTLPAAGMIYAGAKSPNFNRNFKRSKGWSLELIPNPED